MIGDIMPRPARPARRANIPRPMTTMPAVLKKSRACRDCANPDVPNERRANTGNVPMANASIMRNPSKKEPLERATICIDWVNPQGRKNVAKPIMSGVRVLCSIFLKNWNIPTGSVIFARENMPTKLAPSNTITIAAKRPSIDVNIGLILIIPPRAQRRPQRSQKLTILPTWNRIIFFLSLTLSWETCADNENMSPQTTARQLETEAIRPTMKLEIGVTCHPIPKSNIPDFCNRKKSIRTHRPIGRACQKSPQSFFVIFLVEMV